MAISRHFTTLDREDDLVKRSWTALLLCIIGLTLLASTIGTRTLWGLSSWAAVSPLLGFACAIIITPQLLRKSAPDPFRRIPAVRSGVVRLLALAAVSMAVLWLLRSRHDFWGERAALGPALVHGAYRPGAPLSTFVQWGLYRFLNGIFLSSADSLLTLFSMLAGFFYALFAVRAAGLLFTEPNEKGEQRLAVAFLLSNGFVALFFGFGGNAPVAACLVLGFVVTELQCLRGACPPAIAAAFLAAAILSHVSAVYLVPAFIYTLTRTVRSPAARSKPLIAFGALLIGWIALEIIVPRGWGRPGPARYLCASLVHSVAELNRGGWTALARSLWAAVNSLLIIGPASVVSLFLLLTAKRKPDAAPEGTARIEERFLSIAVVSALVMFVVGSPLLDSGLRWHALASTGPAFSVYALWVLKRRSSERQHFAKAAWALVLIGAFLTLPLIVIDAVPRFAEKRIAELPLAPGRSEMIIADSALRNGRLDTAQRWYLASIEKNPSNELANARLGRIEIKQEEYPAAISHFLNARELRPDDPHYRFEFADALIGNRWFPEAIAQLETLTVAYPESVAFWRRLGFARNNGNRYAPAVAAYEKALALEPGNEENLRNLVSALLNRGAELQKEKRYADARAFCNRVIALYPREWRAYNNLAVIEMRLGRYEKAYEILAEALKLHPYESSLNFNMGIVLEKRGRIKEALAYMRAAQALDPVYSNAPMHILRLERKLGIGKAAQVDTQRSPLRIP